MTPQEIAAFWASTRSGFLSIAADIKALTTAVAAGLNQSQVDARIEAKQAEFVGLAVPAYDTFRKLALEMAEDDTEFAALTTVVGGKASQADHLAAIERIADLEAIFAGMPDFAAVYAAAKV
jgi:hypothetical protein